MAECEVEGFDINFQFDEIPDFLVVAGLRCSSRRFPNARL